MSGPKAERKHCLKATGLIFRGKVNVQATPKQTPNAYKGGDGED
jgi:hypothetical protein